MKTKHRAVAAIVSFLGGTALVLGLHHAHRPPASPSTPDVPPVGWTEVCDPAAIALVCRTYPPGDRRWEPSPPLPPQRPLPGSLDTGGAR